MSKVVYAKYSNNRRKEYAIRTELVQDEGGELSVYKREIDSRAHQHVENMVEVGRKLAEEYHNTAFSIPMCCQIDGGIKMPYVSGETVENRLDELLLSGEYACAEKLMLFLLHEIEKGSSRCSFEKTEQFIEFFGDVDLPQNLAATAVADIDLIFANMIISAQDVYSIIDYEWTFLFPVPIHYIQYRSVHHYFQKYNQQIGISESDLFRILDISKEEQTIYEKMEYHFQTKIYNEKNSMAVLHEHLALPIYEYPQDFSLYHRTSHNNEVRIYYSNDGRYDESHSIVSSAVIDRNGHGTFRLNDIPKVRQIRLATSNSNCLLSELHVDILCEDGETRPCWFTTNGINLKNEGILFSENVAFIDLFVREDVCGSLVVHGKVEFLTEHVAQMIRNACMQYDREMDCQKDAIEQYKNENRLISRQAIRLERKLDKMTKYAEQLQKQIQVTEQSAVWQIRQKILGKAYQFMNHNHREIEETTPVLREQQFDSLQEADLEQYTLAVHLHLYYEDLLDEMLTYLQNIPYTYDIYVSCQENANIEQIRQSICEKLKNAGEIVIKACRNRGRDVAPLFVDFAAQISKYDFFVHIHTKKSFHTGEERTDWRGYSMDTILGSEQNIRKIMGLLQQEDVGLVYPELFYELTRYDCTWLSNQDYGERFLKDLNICQPFRIFQYPAGSFYWAKTKALQPLFDLNLQLQDFEEENSQINDTLAHVLERALTFVALSRGYQGAIVDLEENAVRYRISRKSMWEYEKLTPKSIIHTITDYDTISFDFWNTLFALELYRKEDVFRIMEETGVNDVDLKEFAIKRQHAEEQIKQDTNGGGRLEDIYSMLEEQYQWEQEQTKAVMQKEVEIICKYAIPRHDMVDIYQYAIQHNKRVLISADTVLTKEHLLGIMKQHNIGAPHAMYLTSEMQSGKSFDGFWSRIVGESQFVHIGDDPRYDWHVLAEKGVPTILIMSPADEFYMSDAYEKEKDILDGSLEHEKELGQKVSGELFNSPFASLEWE